jgi:hypothetical protein
MDDLIHLPTSSLSVFRKSLPSTSRDPTRIHLSSCEPRRLKYKDLLGTSIWRRRTTSSGLLSGRSAVRADSRGNRVESLYSSRGCEKGDNKTRPLAKRTCSILTDVAENTVFMTKTNISRIFIEPFVISNKKSSFRRSSFVVLNQLAKDKENVRRSKESRE